MKKHCYRLTHGARPLAVALLSASMLIAGTSAHASGNAENGKKIAMSRGQGNCLACHSLPGAESPGNMGPALISMQARFPNPADLRTRIWDATSINPITAMPPYGKHRLLTEQQIDDLVAYLLTI